MSLRSLFHIFCRHRHDRRERDAKGRVVFVCDGCGRSVLALERTTKERKAMAKRYPVPLALKAKGSTEKVTPMRRVQ